MIWVILLIVYIALLSFVVNNYFSRFLDEIRHPEKYEFSTKKKHAMIMQRKKNAGK